MAQKTIAIDDIGPISFYKRRNARNIRIRINGTTVKVTLPSYVPYRAAVLYVKQKKQWIAKNIQKREYLRHGDTLRTGHILSIKYADQSRFTSKISDGSITVTVPSSINVYSDSSQKKLRAVINKVLKTKAEEDIIPRVRYLARQYGYDVRSIQVKNLISRWGSCSSNKDLTFSMYLIQLPQNFIDYVILHELVHTVHLNHQKEFWELLASHVPAYKDVRRQLKNYAPDILLQ